MFKTALIDFDGTLCDTRRAISKCLTKTLEHLDLDSSRVDELIGSGIDLKSTIDQLTGVSEDEIEKLIVEYRRHYNSEFGLNESRLFEGVIDFLKELSKRNIDILVVSNKGVVAVAKALEHFGVKRYIHGVVADTGEGGPKHNPDLCLRLMKNILDECSVNEVLLIGDTVADIEFARKVGIQVACVEYGYGDPADIQAKKPDHFAKELKDLLSLFAQV